MNKHVTVNGPLENPELSQKSHVDNHLFLILSFVVVWEAKKTFLWQPPKMNKLEK